MKKPSNVKEALSLIGNSAALLGGRMVGVLATFAFNVIIARSMAPEQMGVVMSIMSFAFIASVFATLNIESGSIRFLGRSLNTDQLGTASGFVVMSRRVLLIASPIVMLGFVGGAWLLDPQAPAGRIWAYAASAASIPLIGWLRITGRHGTAVAKVTRSSLPRSTLQPLIYLAIISAVVYAGFELTPATVLGLFFFSFMSVALIQYRLLRGALSFIERHRPSFTGWGQWVRSGLLLSTSLIVLEYLQYVIVAAGALGLGAADLAKLSIALRLVAIIRFGQSAVMMAGGPNLASAISRGNLQRRDNLLALSGHLRLWPTLIAVVLLLCFSDVVLGVFGHEYRDASLALCWLVLIPLSTAFFGPNQLLLNITGHSRAIFACCTGMIAALVVSVPWCGHHWGLEGAAAAAALCNLVLECALFVVVRRSTGVDASLIGTFTTTARRLLKRAGKPAAPEPSA